MNEQRESLNRDIFDRSGNLFADNHKISLRQIRRSMTLELFGLSSLMLPGYLAKESGILGVAALGIGACTAFFLLGLWEHLADRGAFTDFGRNRKPLLHRILSVCAGAGMSGIAVFTLFMLTSLLDEHLMGTSYVPVILLSLTAAGIFGLTRGLETRVRVYEILFYFLLIPLVLILILACVNVNPVCWTQTSCSVPGFIKSCYGCFLFFSGASVILLCRTHCNQPEYAIRSARCGILTAAVLNAAVYLILLGVFQDKLLSSIPFPVILLMEVVKIPGRFFEREDTFMIGIWFYCLFALFHSSLFYGKELILNGFRFEKKKPSGKNRKEESQAGKICFLLILGTAVFSSALILHHHDGLGLLFSHALFTWIVPGMLLIPVLYLLCRRRS